MQVGAFEIYIPLIVVVSMQVLFLISNYKCRDCLLFVCFVALRPKSTAMVIAGRSVQLTTLFPGQA